MRLTNLLTIGKLTHHFKIIPYYHLVHTIEHQRNCSSSKLPFILVLDNSGSLSINDI